MLYRSKLDDLRTRKGLTVSELAEQAGITLAAMSRIINGHTHPYQRTQHRIARALGCRVEALGIAQEGGLS